MILRRLSTVCSLAILATASSLANHAIDIEEIVPLQQSEPRFPATMRAIGIKEGHVKMVASVDETGKVTDLFVAESSRRAFAQSARKAVESWTFQPAQYDGVPFPSTYDIELRFELDKELQWQTFTAPVETNIAQSTHDERPITSSQFEQLDRIPLPLELSDPQFDSAEGDVTIEFYIDELGNVRCPKLVSGTDLELGRHTLEIVSLWRFQPPQIQGKRTNTLVRQSFRFRDGKLENNPSS